MIDLAIAVYIIGFLLKLSSALKGVIIGYFISVPFVTLFVFMHNDLNKNNSLLTIPNYFKKLKKSLFFIVPVVVIYTAVPSERNMYVIAGLYAGDKVVNTIVNSEVARQAERTLIAKLKELENEYLENSENGD
ncbi:hypothetical protein [Moraxella bovis]|uniref:hypothetical protein n=1 Tax=Moraxella bovis TaxID=476 RepID=UPI0009933907|nr:hypothetical protein [Moraxella bovis]OOR87074.1 hypothetical protein B0182_13170 [Moraxella bovis]